MRLFAATLLLISLVGELSAAEVPEFIDKPGDYKLFAGKLVIRVTEEGKELQFSLTYASPNGSLDVTSKRALGKAKGWFIVPVSANEVWLYQGGELLQLDEFKAADAA